FLISSEGRGRIAVAMAQLAREYIGLRHREPRALAGEEGNAGRGIADQRRAPSRPVAHSNLADPVEIDTSDARHRRLDRRPFPSPPGEGASQRRLASLVRRGARSGQVLVAEDEEEERPAVAHGESGDLSARNAVADVDQLIPRPIALDLERGDVVAERHL